ncbi:MAG TPA: YajG family lipoprotein [Burkholderiales bacterium]|nr:YajG family lipoprotein [Burkholderiales bacterium]
MNPRSLAVAAIVPLVLATQGCALTTQHLRLDPEIKVAEKQVGAGKTVGLRVSDTRADKKLGEIGDPDRKMVDVLVDQDPSAAIYLRVKLALVKLGYSVEPYADGMDRTLDIRVSKLALESVKQPVTFDTDLRAEVVAHATNANATYDRQFNVRTRMQSAAPPYERESTSLVNTAVSQALEDLLSDENLLALLAK